MQFQPQPGSSAAFPMIQQQHQQLPPPTFMFGGNATNNNNGGISAAGAANASNTNGGGGMGMPMAMPLSMQPGLCGVSSATVPANATNGRTDSADDLQHFLASLEINAMLGEATSGGGGPTSGATTTTMQQQQQFPPMQMKQVASAVSIEDTTNYSPSSNAHGPSIYGTPATVHHSSHHAGTNGGGLGGMGTNAPHTPPLGAYSNFTVTSITPPMFAAAGPQQAGPGANGGTSPNANANGAIANNGRQQQQQQQQGGGGGRPPPSYGSSGGGGAFTVTSSSTNQQQQFSGGVPQQQNQQQQQMSMLMGNAAFQQNAFVPAVSASSQQQSPNHQQNHGSSGSNPHSLSSQPQQNAQLYGSASPANNTNGGASLPYSNNTSLASNPISHGHGGNGGNGYSHHQGAQQHHHHHASGSAGIGGISPTSTTNGANGSFALAQQHLLNGAQQQQQHYLGGGGAPLFPGGVSGAESVNGSTPPIASMPSTPPLGYGTGASSSAPSAAGGGGRNPIVMMPSQNGGGAKQNHNGSFGAPMAPPPQYGQQQLPLTQQQQSQPQPQPQQQQQQQQVVMVLGPDGTPVPMQVVVVNNGGQGNGNGQQIVYMMPVDQQGQGQFSSNSSNGPFLQQGQQQQGQGQGRQQGSNGNFGGDAPNFQQFHQQFQQQQQQFQQQQQQQQQGGQNGGNQMQFQQQQFHQQQQFQPQQQQQQQQQFQQFQQGQFGNGMGMQHRQQQQQGPNHQQGGFQQGQQFSAMGMGFPPHFGGGGAGGNSGNSSIAGPMVNASFSMGSVTGLMGGSGHHQHQPTPSYGSNHMGGMMQQQQQAGGMNSATNSGIAGASSSSAGVAVVNENRPDLLKAKWDKRRLAVRNQLQRVLTLTQEEPGRVVVVSTLEQCAAMVRRIMAECHFAIGSLKAKQRHGAPSSPSYANANANTAGDDTGDFVRKTISTFSTGGCSSVSGCSPTSAGPSGSITVNGKLYTLASTRAMHETMPLLFSADGYSRLITAVLNPQSMVDQLIVNETQQAAAAAKQQQQQQKAAEKGGLSSHLDGAASRTSSGSPPATPSSPSPATAAAANPSSSSAAVGKTASTASAASLGSVTAKGRQLLAKAQSKFRLMQSAMVCIHAVGVDSSPMTSDLSVLLISTATHCYVVHVAAMGAAAFADDGLGPIAGIPSEEEIRRLREEDRIAARKEREEARRAAAASAAAATGADSAMASASAAGVSASLHGLQNGGASLSSHIGAGAGEGDDDISVRILGGLLSDEDDDGAVRASSAVNTANTNVNNNGGNNGAVGPTNSGAFSVSHNSDAIVLPRSPLPQQHATAGTGSASFPTAGAIGGNLRALLESKDITKVTYDCRPDVEVLSRCYGVRLNCVCDLQVMATMAISPRGNFMIGRKAMFQRLFLPCEPDEGRKEQVTRSGISTNPLVYPSLAHFPSSAIEVAVIRIKYYFMAFFMLSAGEDVGRTIAETRAVRTLGGNYDKSSKRDF